MKVKRKDRRRATKATTSGIAGRVILRGIGLAMSLQIACAILWKEFLAVGICLGAVGLTWLLTSRIRDRELRILPRSFSAAVFLWPFIPHPGIEWGSPYPPAGFWVLTGLKTGQLEVCEIISIIIVTLTMWFAGISVHHARHRKNEAPDSEFDSSV